jgi:hypothetical protein
VPSFRKVPPLLSPRLGRHALSQNRPSIADLFAGIGRGEVLPNSL